jgi:uncharacterized protein (DUF2336 family)
VENPTSLEVRDAVAEAAACTSAGPPGSFYPTECRELARTRPAATLRVCARAGCENHLHRWARVDAVYCSGACRMAALRAKAMAR